MKKWLEVKITDGVVLFVVKKLNNMHNCHYCGYYNKKHNYCNDLDCEVDPDDPICSEEYYNS